MADNKYKCSKCEKIKSKDEMILCSSNNVTFMLCKSCIGANLLPCSAKSDSINESKINEEKIKKNEELNCLGKKRFRKKIFFKGKKKKMAKAHQIKESGTNININDNEFDAAIHKIIYESGEKNKLLIIPKFNQKSSNKPCNLCNKSKFSKENRMIKYTSRNDFKDFFDALFSLLEKNEIHDNLIKLNPIKFNQILQEKNIINQIKNLNEDIILKASKRYCMNCIQSSLLKNNGLFYLWNTLQSDDEKSRLCDKKKLEIISGLENLIKSSNEKNANTGTNINSNIPNSFNNNKNRLFQKIFNDKKENIFDLILGEDEDNNDLNNNDLCDNELGEVGSDAANKNNLNKNNQNFGFSCKDDKKEKKIEKKKDKILFCKEKTNDLNPSHLNVNANRRSVNNIMNINNNINNNNNSNNINYFIDKNHLNLNNNQSFNTFKNNGYSFVNSNNICSTPFVGNNPYNTFNLVKPQTPSNKLFNTINLMNINNNISNMNTQNQQNVTQNSNNNTKTEEGSNSNNEILSEKLLNDINNLKNKCKGILAINNNNINNNIVTNNNYNNKYLDMLKESMSILYSYIDNLGIMIDNCNNISDNQLVMMNSILANDNNNNINLIMSNLAKNENNFNAILSCNLNTQIMNRQLCELMNKIMFN